LRPLVKLVNYFITNYSSSSKFRHSIYHYLKIFYEKASKLNSNYSSFGNVYKNSKWSNYKIQNVKTSFIPSFNKLFLFSFLTFVLLFNYKQEFILLKEVTYYILHFIVVDFLYDYVNLLIASILLLLYWLKTYIIQYYIFLISPFKRTQNKTSKPRKNFSNVRSKRTLNFNKSYLYDINNKVSSCEHINVMSTIFKIKNSMLWTNFNVDSLSQYKLDSINSKLYMYNSRFILSPNLIKQQVHYKYRFSSTLNKLDLNIPYQSNLNNTINLNYNKSISNGFFNSTLFDSILSSSINLLKQVRWLTKNSLVSDKFIFSTNLFTEYKKLIGNTLTLSNLSNNNVWASSNLSKDFNSQKLMSGIYSQKNLNFNAVQLLNDFEQSRLWLFKKIYFSSVLKNVDTTISYAVNTKPYRHNIKEESYTLSNLTNKSMLHNLIFLDNTLVNKSRFIHPNYVNLNNSNFSYNVYDYNLLTDDNLESIINSFHITNYDINSSVFNSNLFDDNKEQYEFTLKYRK